MNNTKDENIEEKWNKSSEAIKEVAEQEIGKLKSGKKKWYNEKFREAIEKQRMSCENYIKFNDANIKIL